MVAEEYKDCLAYIDAYWPRIIKSPNEVLKGNGFLKLPKQYLTPNDKKFSYLFYWDSYFMFRGLIGNGHTELLRDVVDNYIYLIKRYGIIPNFNSHASTNRSQPPFLSSMILDVFRETRGKKSLAKRMEWAKWEYEHVWIDADNHYNHGVDGYDLSKYGDRDVGYAHSSELESGWDFTSRFYSRCNEFLPVDLNCFLYKYEQDFAYTARVLGDKKEEKFWQKKSEHRANLINHLMWNKREGFYFDYDFVHKKQSKFLSLAGFMPLWAGIATAGQAEKMVQKLVEFETKYGLVVTAASSLAPNILAENFPDGYRKMITELMKPKQWDYPNIWPPVEYLVVIGLLKYGYIDEAKRIMHKSLVGEAKIFRKYGTFFEKMDGVKGDIAGSFHYTNQSGFGWTNAVFYRYIQILSQMDREGDDSIYFFPMNDIPPYSFNILV